MPRPLSTRSERSDPTVRSTRSATKRSLCALLSLTLLHTAVLPVFAGVQAAGGMPNRESKNDSKNDTNPTDRGRENGDPPGTSKRNGVEADRRTGKEAPTNGDTGKSPTRPANGKTTPSSNPLLLPTAEAGSNATPRPKTDGVTDFADYRRLTEAGISRTKSVTLPLFGYDFFQSARELIQAHRAYLRRRYQNPTENGANGSNSNRSKNRSDTDASSGARDGTKNNGQSQDNGQNSSRDSDTPGNGERANERQNPDKDGSGKDGTGSGPETNSGTDNSGSSILGKRPTGSAAMPRHANSRSDSADSTDGFPDRKKASASDTEDSQGQRPRNGGSSDNTSINAYEEVADPLSQLYRNVTATVPPTYQLAAGDTLTVRYWSPRHETKTLESKVDSQGALRIEDLGQVIVRGLTLEQAEKAIRERLRRYYNGVETSVTVGKLRTIQITVSGAAYQPGTYTVPAVATAYNILYAAGGPTEDGSLRTVEVRRDGKRIGTLDLYHFLLVGTRATDIPLQSGDLIYIPRRSSHVAVLGEVLQPAVFELSGQETLQDALRYAGGIKASGVAQRVRISTVVPGQARILKDIDLRTVAKDSKTDTKQDNNPPLYDGDEVEVFSLRPLLTNTVTVEGAVDQPSEYALSPGMKISDLIERARGVISEAYLTRANLYRWNADNTTALVTIDLQKALMHDPKCDIVLTRWDRLTVFTREEVAWTGRRTVTVRGAVQRPGSYSRSDSMRVSDLLLLAGGPTPDAYRERGVILHQHGDGTFALDYVNLDRVQQENNAGDVVLQDNDVLAIYRVGEAQFAPEHVVTIKGEVVTGGPFPRTEGMHVSDLLLLSGGFTPKAGSSVCIAHARRIAQGNDNSLKVVTVNFDAQHRCAPGEDALLEDGDVVTVQGAGGYVDKVHTINVQGAVNKPGPIILSSKSIRLSDAIRLAGGLRPEAFPQGAEFYRDSKILETDSQRSLATIISGLNDLLNESTFNREKGKSYVERIRAINGANQSESDSPLTAGRGNTSAPADVSMLTKDLAQQQLVSPARKLTDEQMNTNGNIAINLLEAMRHERGGEDILLVDGDTITVPETPTTVQVVGAVFHSRGVLYKPGASLDYYLAQSGGCAPDAARDRIEIIHVGGGLIPAAKSGALKPGDVILVPTRVLAEKLTSNQNGFSSFFRSLTNSAIIFRVATSLFGL